jgi:CRISPR-associated protein Cst1
MVEEYVDFKLGSSFLINAGLCGLLKYLEQGGAEEGKDYYINDYFVRVQNQFLQEHDLAALYIDSIVEHFRKTTKYYYVVQKESQTKKLLETENRSKEEEEQLHDLFKELADMLNKNSFLAGYEIIEQETGKNLINKVLVSEFTKEKDLLRKGEQYFHLLELLKQKEIADVLIMKDVLYTKLNLFYEAGMTFLLRTNNKKSFKELYNKDFVEPLLAEIKSSKAGKKRCIECSALTSQQKAISFMVDTSDDLNRKKSHYWNLKADASVCPMCAFLYSLVPLGFVFCGADAVFINQNGSVNSLVRIMGSYEVKTKDTDEDGKPNPRQDLFRIFTTNGIDLLEKGLQSIQVVVKLKNSSHYDLRIIGRDLIKNLADANPDLKKLAKIWIKGKEKGYINIYDEVLRNILLRRNQYDLINHLLKLSLDENSSTSYLKHILNIQCLIKGGSGMDILQKKVNSAWFAGSKLRQSLGSDLAEKDKDNHLRSLVYQLNNALSVRNREQFLNTVIRIYSGRGLAIPAVFKDCYESDEMLQALGYGFILGLKSSVMDEKDKSDAKQNKEDVQP